MAKLFGTDGIRGVAGAHPLTNKEIKMLGRAAGQVLHRKFPKEACRVLIVRDTRLSGASILKNLSEGLREEGVDVFDGGILCTPSVAYIVKAHHFQSGVVISASHNPPEFNGIKFFTFKGIKWPDDWEADVESIFFNLKEKNNPPKKKLKNIKVGQHVKAEALGEDYVNFLIETLGSRRDFSGLRIGVDCGNGANYRVAPEVFQKLGAEVHAISIKPNGRNINVGCGSQHTEKLSSLVKKKKCHAGIAFDGDADRVIMVDEKGDVIDGDYIIALLAKVMKGRKELKNGLAVITVMANLGLKKALKKIGVNSIETPVGDRHVSAAMKRHHSVLGGEQSGHIILGEHLPTGDGLLTALHVLAALKESGEPFSKLAGWMKKYPQVLLNVPVKERKPIAQLNGVSKKIEDAEKTLGEDGRVLVRYSGTEPLLRIMLEGPDLKRLNEFAEDIAASVKKANS